MSAQSSGLTPRSSISSQPSASSSSLPIARRSQEPGSFDGRVNQNRGEVEDGGEIRVLKERIDGQGRTVDIEQELREDRQPKRQKPRNSGGFLLQSPTPPQAPETITRSSAGSDIAKSKRKAEDGEIVVPKRALGRHLPKLVGGSPLASEITTSQDGADDETSRVDNRHSIHSSSSGNRGSAGSRSSTGPERISYQRSVLGQNTDPAEIVNLALNLSESRRRNISGASTFMPRDAFGGRRTTSATQQTLGIPYGASGGSLRQHLREQRRISRNISPRSSGSAGRKGKRSSPQLHKRSSRYSSETQAFETNMDEDVSFHASDATFARAEKARAALELGYEYRRLLQYLPTIPKSMSRTGKGTERGLSQVTPGLGRAYNPLQYVRNRKVRFRDKRPLNPELDGWKDVDRVRAWVDAVKSEREIGISRVDDRFPMPPFDAVADKPTVVDCAESPNVTQSKSLSAAHTTRPKLDWTFAPSDLLADVYWMNQGHNIERIEDRSWQKIIRSPDSNKGGPLGTNTNSPRSPDVRKSTSLTRQDISPERSRDLAANGHCGPHERGRRRKGHHELKSSVDLEDGSRTRRSRWPKKLLRSRSSSSSSQSDWSSRSRHRRGINSQNNFDNAALEKHMLEMLVQEAEVSRSLSKAMNGEVKKSDSANKDLGQEKGAREVQHHVQDPRRLKTDMPLTKPHVPLVPQIRNTEGPHRRISSEDLRTAPTSPIVPGLAPSIAVDLSPPESPPTNTPNSTLSPLKRPFASRLGSFRRDRSRSVGVRAASENDASKEQESSPAMSRQVTNEAQPRHRLIKQRSTEPSNGSLSPYKNDLSGSRTRIHDSKSTRISKEANSSDSKIRGFFKGGRIAELVGNEVSKVGDILWKKDGNNNPFQMASPTGSDPNSDGSDQEDQAISGVDSSPSENLSPVTSNADRGATQPPKATSERQKYYMGNLPTLRSRFAANDQSSTLAAPLPNEDHIARQQRMMKERGRSFKFDRLAPPKIDMRSVSPSPSLGPSRSQSRDPIKDQSRDSSGSRSTRGVQDADKRLNDMLGIPGRVGTGKVAPTGLAAFSSNTGGQRARGRPDIKRQWSISDRGISAVRGTITKRDIARVRALLLSSGVKATEISRLNDEPPAQPPALLQGLQDIIKGPIPLIPPSQEFVFAARALIADIEDTNMQLRDLAEDFSKDNAENLHNQIKAVDEQVNFKLTPLVRTAADDADDFSTELTTTHTLAVRQLNDSVDIILRKRRRRLRWVRRIGWALLEWTVLGVMWMVWFIVVIVRVLRGIVGGVASGIRWLLFL